ncbi:ERCC4 domain-containing protein [Methanonatronarchaeum sp. AMET-Sl]|uniref:ERCC4 domain-containing protein n=1 Tax=Methanonatronarchaeum sp. AMET-Sl TaxID=3037654 RepID=UPI00244E28DD|nr:ERCC4 domain-containing protein [Methanonatronarchaeum sp. AMET-Sl]WGI17344.1 ERCC4 domain-containing protein [Methanonatronarchaeum sp. AMET-Sl]
MDFPTVVVDYRERRCDVFRALKESDVEVVVDKLDIGDYVLSDRACVERKSTMDFVSSMVDRDRGLFDQLSELRDNFECPVLVIEGLDTRAGRDIHINSIRGAISSISIDYGIPIIRTEDSFETAEYIKLIAKREQIGSSKTPNPHSSKPTKSMGEIQRYVASSIPMVGPKTAETLLIDLGSVKNIFTASKEELMEVDGVGEKTAEKIIEVVKKEYKEEN